MLLGLLLPTQLHNTDASALTVALHLVPNGAGSVGTAASTNMFYNVSIPSNGTRILEYAVPGLMLDEENDTIQAVTSIAAKITYTITGGQE